MADAPAPKFQSRKGTTLKFYLDPKSAQRGSADEAWAKESLRSQILDAVEPVETDFPDAQIIYVVAEEGWTSVAFTVTKPTPDLLEEYSLTPAEAEDTNNPSS